jgi:hemerythrin-like domain-containing protein
MKSETRSSDITPADVLSEHHRVLDEQLDRLIGDSQVLEADDLRAAWSTFEKDLLRHLEYEEAAILPAFARGHASEAKAIRDEHARIRAALLDLGVSLDLHALRCEAVRDFVGQLRAHARREDALLYPWARRHVAAGGEEPPRHGFLGFGARLM